MVWPCAGNQLGKEGGKAMAEALKVNKTLLHLDLGCEHGDRHRGWVGRGGGLKSMISDVRRGRGGSAWVQQG